MKMHNKTDWDRVKAEAAAEAPVAHDQETDLYDPNDGAAARAYWSAAKVTRPGRPRAAVKRPSLNMRIDADLMEHPRQCGKGWQTRVNNVLREAVEKGVL
ncbi:BrnA antitoxin family protein [Bordetella genomosp. 9]|uniref:Toxin-antitoxin system, antitoxin component n=1 Tax=Bordetella genomosp. 9 TaxID=1416803 RepID=A0A1W6Z2H1_9BORD|nr:BrnA antitoxin family protein [Bordetella genomosp. 9]ARP87582.1 hypothetical protein CAL13_16255 [Bordetella genomosp. 9]